MSSKTIVDRKVYREYEISFPGFFRDYPSYSKTLMSTSGNAAKYECYLEFSDAYPDMTFLDFLKIIKCRSMRNKVDDSIVYPPVNHDRIEIANKMIREIGSRGRKFLYSERKNRFAEFRYEGRKLWFFDHYSDMPMHMLPNETYKTRQQSMNFSSGGTMWGLMNDFKDFIYGDDDSNHNNGYGGLYCPHWGYPAEDMEALRKIAIELGYLKGWSHDRDRTG